MKSRMSLRVAALVVAGMPIPSAVGATIKTVVTSDMAVPGMSGVTFGNLQGVAPGSGQNRVFFLTNLAGAGVTSGNDQSMWLKTGGQFIKVAREADQVPAMPPGVSYSSFFGFSSVNDTPQVSLFAGLQGGGYDSDHVLLAGDAGAMRIVARSTPGGGTGNVFSQFGQISTLSDSGKQLFVAYGGGESNANTAALWIGGGDGSLTRIVTSGDPAPGTQTTFSGQISPGEVRINGHDDIAFVGLFGGSDLGIWAKPSGSAMQKIAAKGDTAPGTPAGVTFSQVRALSEVTEGGLLAFRGTLQGSGVTIDNNVGIWAQANGQLTKVMRDGEAAPGTNSIFIGPGPNPVVSESGRIAFREQLSGTALDNDSMWSGVPGAIAMVIREGQHAPGTEDGVVFDTFSDPMINDAGDIWFYATLRGPGVTNANLEGVWELPADDALQLIARRGDTLEIAPGDLRTTSQVFGGHLFRATFTDGTIGLFEGSVPEPAGMGLAAGGLLLCLRRQRRDAGNLRSNGNSATRQGELGGVAAKVK